MPVYLARWLNGDFAIVNAKNEAGAFLQLDEIADRPAGIWKMESCLIDFELTANGTFRLCEFGADTANEILEKSYPALLKALEGDPEPEITIVDGSGNQKAFTLRTARAVKSAAKLEQKRLMSSTFRPPHSKSELDRLIRQTMIPMGPKGASSKAKGKQIRAARPKEISQ